MATKQGFASILDSLRTVDDTFSFTIDGGEQDGERIPMAGSMVLIGLDRSERRIASDPNQIHVPCLVASKDWSGVEIAATGQREILVNGSTLKGRQRLSHGDRLGLPIAGTRTADGHGVQPQVGYLQLLFQEPVSLSILDSMLPPEPQPPEPQSPEPGSEPETVPASEAPRAMPVEETTTVKASVGGAAVFSPAESDVRPEAASGNGPRRYLGYFTLIELLLMTFGTLILSLILFLALLYMTRAIND